MRFSLRLNNDLLSSAYVPLAQLAESVGFDQFWISNDLFLRSALPILTATLLNTQRIEVGSCILNPYTINPAEMAMAAATMDELSGSRFNLGLAAGAADFLRWVGLEQDKPLAAVRESTECIRRLLCGDAATKAGQFLQWSPETYLRFKAPRVTPIYVGAMGPKMLMLAGEIGDGVLPLLFPPEHYFGVRPLLQEGVARRSSKLDAFDFAACIWVSLSEDVDAARRVLSQKIAYYGPSLSPFILERLDLTPADFLPVREAMAARDMDSALKMIDERMLRIGIVGQPSDVIQRLEPLVAAGANHLSFGPPLGPDLPEAIRLLGKVIAHFR